MKEAKTHDLLNWCRKIIRENPTPFHDQRTLGADTRDRTMNRKELPQLDKKACMKNSQLT